MFQMIPLTHLKPTKDNVRTLNGDKAADRELLAGIESEGLLQNLVVKPNPRKAGHYLVMAGGRRLAALQTLAKQGKIEKDAEQPCKVVEDARNAKEVSLKENLQRLPLHPADRFTAFKDLADKGLTQQDIAQRFGLPIKEVKRTLRLADVHPDIVEAYRHDKIRLEAVMAYAATTDQAHQAAAFKALPLYQQNESLIRNRLMAGAVDSKSQIAKAVGLKAYRAAGGRTESDLFGNRTYLLDGELVERLLAERLEAKAQELRDAGWGWVETVSSGWSNTEHLPRGKSEYIGPPELLEERDECAREIDRIESTWADSPTSDDPEEQGDAAETYAKDLETAEMRLDEIEAEIESQTRFKNMAGLGCLVRLGENGKVVVIPGLKKPSSKPANKPDAKAARGQPGEIEVPQALQTDLRHWRLDALLDSLRRSPGTAGLLLQFHICDQALFRHADHVMYRQAALALRIDTHYQNHHQPAPDSPGKARFREAWSQIAETAWATHKAIEDRFKAFCELDDDSREQQMALAVCLTVDPGSFDRLLEPLAELLADDAAAIDVPGCWEVTGETYFGRLRKPALMELAKKLLPPEGQPAENIRKGDLVEMLDQHQREGDTDGWLPPEMRIPGQGEGQ